MSEVQRIESLYRPQYKSLEDLFHGMELPIALVGNGTISQEYGTLIDSCKSIIRVNNFKLNGFEKFVGTRTTHWCVHGKVDQVPFMPAWKRWIFSRFDRWRLLGIQPNPHVGTDVHYFMPKAFELLSVGAFKKYFNADLICLRDASYLYPVYDAVPKATTGFLTMYLLSQFAPEVSVFGFSGLQGGHYYNKTHKHNRRHMPKASLELDLIRASQHVKFYA